MVDEATESAPAGQRSRSDWWLYAIRGFVIALQSVVFLGFAWILTPAEFGRFALAFAIARILAAVASAGMATYLLREIPARRVQGQGAVPLGPFLVLALFLPLALAATGAAGMLHLPFEVRALSEVRAEGGEIAVAIAALGFALSLVAVTGTLVRTGSGSLAGMAVQQALPFAALAAAMVPDLVGEGHDLTRMLFVTAVLLIAICAVLMITQTRRMSPPLARHGTHFPISTALREAVPFWGNGLLIALTTQLDMVIAALFISDAELGVYSVIRNVANVVAVPRMIANWAVATRIARSWAVADLDSLRASILHGRHLSARPALAGALLILVSAPVWFRVFDVPVRETWPWLVLGLLLAGNLAIALLGLAIICASQCGLEGLALRVRVVVTILGAGVAAAGGALAGSPGIAAGVCFMAVALNAAIALAVRRRTGIATF